MRNPRKTLLRLYTWGVIHDPDSEEHFAPRVVDERVQAYLKEFASRPPQPTGERISTNANTIITAAATCQGELRPA